MRAHTHRHTHRQHLAALSNTRHGNGTAAIRGEEPFPSIEGETESKMKGRKRAGEGERKGDRKAGGGGRLGRDECQRNGAAQEGEKGERERKRRRR